MCGIVGYIGFRQAVPVLVDGLRRLEYRGYDSAGVAWIDGGELNLVRAQGKLAVLERRLAREPVAKAVLGLGHTRWATHGEPNEANAHPHTDCTGSLVVVHNGIIENYRALREELEAQGHRFRSNTDTEVLAHLVERYMDGDLAHAVRQALSQVKGAFAVGVIHRDFPDRMVVAKLHSPLVLGVGEEECLVASDIPALLTYTRNLIFLEDGEMAVVTAGKVDVRSISTWEPLQKEITPIDWSASMAEKAGYKHFMLKEIIEQPQAVMNTFMGRMDPSTGEVTIPEAEVAPSLFSHLSRVTILACGTSWHAGLVARYWIEKWAGIPVEVELASEFRYRGLAMEGSVLTVAISQSGETADTLAGIRRARELGSSVVAICNVVGSTVTREATATLYTHAGPEIGVASTKAFTSQLTALYLLGLSMAGQRGKMTLRAISSKVAALATVPRLIEEWIPRWREGAGALADRFYQAGDFLYLGRDLMFPIALEGALKLKEISYIHAEGYAAGEMKHGPIALIDRQMPVVALMPRDHVYDKMLSNVEEVRSRRGVVIGFGQEGDAHAAGAVDHFVALPQVEDADITPFLYTVPLQLLAYEIAVARGCDVDQPRNLAKSVTVE